MTVAQPVLLFDLGGVLVKNAMFSELKRLMGSDRSEAELIDAWLRNPVARQYELGRCSTDDFCRGIVGEFELAMAPGEFLEAFKRWPQGFMRASTRCWPA